MPATATPASASRCVVVGGVSSSVTSQTISPAATPAPTARRQIWSTTVGGVAVRVGAGGLHGGVEGEAVALLGERDDGGDEVLGAIAA